MKLLFICTHNRCRSILSEAITNHLGGTRLEALSAGSQPVGQVHPLSIKYLQEANIDTQGLSSQSWDEHEDANVDVVITVCDSAAGETCPVWFGKSLKVHWGLPDPSRIEGGEETVANAFRAVMKTLSLRIQAVLEADFEQMNDEQKTELFTQLADLNLAELKAELSA